MPVAEKDWSPRHFSRAEEFAAFFLPRFRRMNRKPAVASAENPSAAIANRPLARRIASIGPARALLESLAGGVYEYREMGSVS